MSKTIIFIILAISMILPFAVFAQENETAKLRVAVLPFEARPGVDEEDAATIADWFRTELVKTEAYIIVEREQMRQILTEHALKLAGVTAEETEYAVEAGKLLDAQKMISGSIGRIGQELSVNISLLDVSSGQIEESFSRKYAGDIEQIQPTLREIALKVAGVEYKGISKAPLYIFGSASIASLGMSVYSFFMANDSYDKYQSATTVDDLKKYKDDTEQYDTITLYSAGIAGGTALGYYLYRKAYKKSLKPVSINVGLYSPDENTLGITLRTTF